MFKLTAEQKNSVLNGIGHSLLVTFDDVDMTYGNLITEGCNSFKSFTEDDLDREFSTLVNDALNGKEVIPFEFEQKDFIRDVLTAYARQVCYPAIKVLDDEVFSMLDRAVWDYAEIKAQESAIASAYVAESNAEEKWYLEQLNSYAM